MNFDTPPRNARVLTIIEAADGTAWVAFHPDTIEIRMDRSWGSRPQDCTNRITIDGQAHVVVAQSVEEAMRVAAEYWAQPRPQRRNGNQINNMKGITQ